MSSNGAALAWLLAERPNVCRWCSRCVKRGQIRDRMAATVDHLLPRERDGHTHRDDGYYNCALSCRGCNERRAAAGHCIAALRCYEAVKGRRGEQGAVARWFAGARPSSPKNVPLTGDTRRPMVISSGPARPTFGDAWDEIVQRRKGVTVRRRIVPECRP